MNCATTIDLNPVALFPSATNPHMPKTERRDMLKMYGDAEVTVSLFSDKEDPVTEGSGFSGAFCTWYVSWVVLNFSVTTNCPLYPSAAIPWILNGVSTSKPGTSVVVVTVIIFVDPPGAPVPARILEIPVVAPVDPTILNSSILGWISIPEEG